MTNLDADELSYELKQSKQDLEENLNTKVSYFSYPIGDYNKKVINETQKYYNVAFIVSDKMLNTEKLSQKEYLYKLPRINITDKNLYEFYFRINEFHLLLKKLIK